MFHEVLPRASGIPVRTAAVQHWSASAQAMDEMDSGQHRLQEVKLTKTPLNLMQCSLL